MRARCWRAADDATLLIKKKLALLRATRQAVQQPLTGPQVMAEPVQPRFTHFGGPQVLPVVQMDYDVRDSVYRYDNDLNPADPVTVLDWDLNDPVKHL